MMQSPININSMKVDYCPDWGYEKFTFECEEFLEVISGDDYRVEDIGNAYIFYHHPLENWYEAYSAKWFRWHTHSEHQING